MISEQIFEEKEEKVRNPTQKRLEILQVESLHDDMAQEKNRHNNSTCTAIATRHTNTRSQDKKSTYLRVRKPLLLSRVLHLENSEECIVGGR